MASFQSNNDFIKSEHSVAISIGHTSNQNLHLKLLIKLMGEVKEVHLGWHHDFVFQDIEHFDSYIWAVPQIPPSRLKSVAAKCFIIAENQKKNKNPLPYAIGYYSLRSFDKEGIYIDVDGIEYGMTCATFILTVFKSVGVDLIDWKEWPKGREEDLPWFNTILSYLEKGVERGMVSSLHYENVKTESNCARYRPQEVFSSVYCMKNDTPAKFQCCESFGNTVKDYTRKLPPQYT